MAAMNFAKSPINIKEQNLSIIMQSKKPCFSRIQNHWPKKLEIMILMYLWVATMVLRHMSWFIYLNKVTSIINKSDILLYCNDGLETFENVSKPEIEKKKEAIVKVFKGGCHINHFAKKITSQFM